MTKNWGAGVSFANLTLGGMELYEQYQRDGTVNFEDATVFTIGTVGFMAQTWMYFGGRLPFLGIYQDLLEYLVWHMELIPVGKWFIKVFMN